MRTIAICDFFFQLKNTDTYVPRVKSCYFAMPALKGDHQLWRAGRLIKGERVCYIERRFRETQNQSSQALHRDDVTAMKSCPTCTDSLSHVCMFVIRFKNFIRSSIRIHKSFLNTRLIILMGYNHKLWLVLIYQLIRQRCLPVWI